MKMFESKREELYDCPFVLIPSSYIHTEIGCWLSSGYFFNSVGSIGTLPHWLKIIVVFSVWVFET